MLSDDAELAPLFCFNSFIDTVRGSRSKVDLVWTAGGSWSSSSAEQSLDCAGPWPPIVPVRPRVGAVFVAAVPASTWRRWRAGSYPLMRLDPCAIALINK
jgi:hypothetical protein